MSYDQWIPFLVKSLIVGVIVAILGVFLLDEAASRAENLVSRVAEQISPIGYFPGRGKLGRAGERLAINLQEMTPWRRKELIAVLRAIVIELKPFAVELWPLVMDPSTGQRTDCEPR